MRRIVFLAAARLVCALNVTAQQLTPGASRASITDSSDATTIGIIGDFRNNGLASTTADHRALCSASARDLCSVM
jgi:hypothetical protein